MELLVVIAIILVLAAITYPVINTINQHKNKAYALARMRDLVTACNTYTTEHDGSFPAEDSKGTDDWKNASLPENKDAWYNALPRQLNMKGVGDFAHNGERQYYTKENPLFLPGAKYPETDKKLVRPLFAIAINTKLQRKDEAGKKAPLKIGSITIPSRTAIFLEQGLPGEKDISLKTQPKYDGSPKGSAKSFVGRYAGTGVIAFVDGHIDTFEAKDLLTDAGHFPFPPTDVVWCRTPEEDPNK